MSMYIYFCICGIYSVSLEYTPHCMESKCGILSAVSQQSAVFLADVCYDYAVCVTAVIHGTCGICASSVRWWLCLCEDYASIVCAPHCIVSLNCGFLLWRNNAMLAVCARMYACVHVCVDGSRRHAMIVVRIYIYIYISQQAACVVSPGLFGVSSIMFKDKKHTQKKRQNNLKGKQQERVQNVVDMLPRCYACPV